MDERSKATRDQLLLAATRVFAEHGFKSATIRQISELAGANVASVNYHFGDKEALYREVLQRSFDRLGKLSFSAPEQRDAPTAAIRFHAFVEGALRLLFSDVLEDEGLQGRVLLREAMTPTPGLESLVGSLVEPYARLLDRVVRDLVGSGSDEQTVRLCVASVAGQILFHHHFRASLNAFLKEPPDEAASIALLADHIARFSIAALRSFGSPSFSEVGVAADPDPEPSGTEIHLL